MTKQHTGKLHRLDRCFLDWTNQCKSHLPLVAKSAFLQTATAAHISGPIYEAFFCSGSLKPGSFGYLRQTAFELIGPIKDTLVESTIFDGNVNYQTITRNFQTKKEIFFVINC